MAKKKRNPKKFTQFMKKKLVMVFFLIVLALGILIGRLFYIQHRKGEEYEKKVLSQQGYESQSIPYQRGDILDSHGTVLATSVDVYNVILDCKLINEDEKYIEPTIAALVQCIPEVTEEEIRAALTEKADSRYFVLRKKLPYEEIQDFEKLQDKVYTKGKKKGDKVNPNIQGVWFEKEYIRKYPYNSLACKVLGFTTSGNVGIGGLEDYYNDTLNGINGRQYGYLNADNNFEKTIKEAVNGKSLVTTIDMNIQNIVEKKIAEFNEAHANEAAKGPGSQNTAVIVMNPQNAEILAMADSRGYDLNDPWNLSAYYTQEEIDTMDEETTLNNLNKIWQNFCTTYTYEPGSTVKPFTVAAGLETGKIKESDPPYFCDGYQEVGGHKIKCVANSRGGHGAETIEQSIMNSCNDALMQMADKIGKEEFSKYQNIFNFGLKTNIDLPGEARTDTLVKKADKMGSADLATYSFGQNFNVTMIQLASAFSSIINGGEYYQPHLVKKIVDDNGNTVKNIDPVLLKQTISKQTSDTVKGYLYSTVSTGTGKSAKVEGYSMGGKTGTAEKYPRRNGKYLVSFIGFAPVENPEVLVYVVIDEPNVENQAQSSLATNLAKDIFTELFPYMNIYKDEEDPQAKENAKSQEEQAQMSEEEQDVGQENYREGIFE